MARRWGSPGPPGKQPRRREGEGLGRTATSGHVGSPPAAASPRRTVPPCSPAGEAQTGSHGGRDPPLVLAWTTRTVTRRRHGGGGGDQGTPPARRGARRHGSPRGDAGGGALLTVRDQSRWATDIRRITASRGRTRCRGVDLVRCSAGAGSKGRGSPRRFDSGASIPGARVEMTVARGTSIETKAIQSPMSAPRTGVPPRGRVRQRRQPAGPWSLAPGGQGGPGKAPGPPGHPPPPPPAAARPAPWRVFNRPAPAR